MTDRFEDFVPFDERGMTINPARTLVQAGLAQTKDGKKILRDFKKGKIKAPKEQPASDYRAQRDYRNW